MRHGGRAGTDAPCVCTRGTSGGHGGCVMNRNPFAICLQQFFTDHLTIGLRASAHTIASYRDTFRLLLNYASDQLCRTPTDLTFEDLDANLVGRFLGFVETVRGNSVRSRNTRLSAIRSFFKYVATHEPQLVHHCHRILSIPAKKYERTTITYLNRAEMAALVAAPDSSTWFGRRDRTLLVVALQTGLRVSELINLSRGDIVLGTGAHVRCMGKGRKERATPLRKDSVDALRSWLTERPGNDGDPLFISIRGGRLSRDAVERIVQKYTALATEVCPSLKGKRVTPHVLRHAAAMTLLQSGVDCAVIALWLGHESLETTQIYLHADLQLKEKAMDQTKPVGVPSGRYQPPDEVMTFLEAL